jgi:hypothetical protein
MRSVAASTVILVKKVVMPIPFGLLRLTGAPPISLQ